MNLRDIPGYEGRYAASDDGRIYSHVRTRFLVTSTNSRYLKVTLIDIDGRRRDHNVHRLVAAAWLRQRPEDKNEINHRDGRRHNNAPDNLEWTTGSENCKHAWRTGLIKQWDGAKEHAAKIGRASNVKRRKLSAEDARQIRERAAAGEVQGELAKEYRVSPMCLNKLVNRVTYKDIV